jgi:hypothetical protein
MNLELLHSRLTDFGLNPSEWVLQVLDSKAGMTQLSVRSLQAAGPHFTGWAEKSLWLSLAWCEH